MNSKRLLAKFGSVIRNHRQKNNLSQEKLGQISGLDRTYIGGVERGERNISLKNINLLAIALHITLETLFREVEENE